MTMATWQELLRDDARTMVMGIINATPDSFSGDGVYADSETVGAAVALAEAIGEPELAAGFAEELKAIQE